MHTLSIRGLDDEALAALKARARQDKTSVNSAVLRLIDEGLGRGAAPRRHRHNDLEALGGTWTAQDLAEFESATAPLDHIDPELWKPAA